MRKQTKLVAVLSAAALLAMGASMTSFAAGWERDDDGTWHYYDSEDEMVYDEWAKDGSNWYYLDEDGNMLIDSWVDDEYYVGEDGAMLVNEWKKTYADEDMDDPDEDGEHWYYFGSKGKKVVDDTRKINGRTYLFDEDGEMQYGWQEDDNGNGYYYGGEDEGWRTEDQWLWLERSGLVDEDEDEQKQLFGCTEDEENMCDDEGWYWFQSSGKVYNGSSKKKINGKYYMFNKHGQMLYEWINNSQAVTHGSNSQLDNETLRDTASASDMLYYNVVEDGSRGNGWQELDGSISMGTDNDTDWYYIDDGEMLHASNVVNGSDYATDDEDREHVFRMRDKVKESGNKYFCFNENGQMQTGLQYIKDAGGFFYYDENGYQKDGRVTSIECDDDDYTFYFNTSNGKNGLGYTGEKDNYLYFNGKRLEADDDYRFYYVEGDVYLVNTKGKIQKATGDGKKYDDIENEAYNGKEDVIVITNKNGVVKSINGVEIKNKEASDDILRNIDWTKDVTDDKNSVSVTIPFIALYDDVYTYQEQKDGKIMATWRGDNQ